MWERNYRCVSARQEWTYDYMTQNLPRTRGLATGTLAAVARRFVVMRNTLGPQPAASIRISKLEIVLSLHAYVIHNKPSTRNAGPSQLGGLPGTGYRNRHIVMELHIRDLRECRWAYFVKMAECYTQYVV